MLVQLVKIKADVHHEKCERHDMLHSVVGDVASKMNQENEKFTCVREAAEPEPQANR